MIPFSFYAILWQSTIVSQPCWYRNPPPINSGNSPRSGIDANLNPNPHGCPPSGWRVDYYLRYFFASHCNSCLIRFFTSPPEFASDPENWIFGLSIFIFAQELYCAVMKNDDLDSTPIQPSSLSESYTKEAPPYTKRYKLWAYATISPPLSKGGLEGISILIAAT